MASTTSSTEDRALELLGQGIEPTIVASACGVEVSRISQLLADPEFAKKVSERRFLSLASHSARDASYDALEEKLQKKLDSTIPYLIKPMEIARVLQTVNAAKRRGSSAPASLTNQQTVVPLIMSTQIVQMFSQTNNLTLNTNNQVVKAGDTDLVTVQSGAMNRLLAANKEVTDV